MVKTSEYESSLGLEFISTRAFSACVTDAGLLSSVITGRGWLVGTDMTDTPCCVILGSAEGNGLIEWHRVLD